MKTTSTHLYVKAATVTVTAALASLAALAGSVKAPSTDSSTETQWTARRPPVPRVKGWSAAPPSCPCSYPTPNSRSQHSG